jgi:hypothetical protein
LQVVEDVKAVCCTAEVGECDEEGEEVRGVVSVVRRCDGHGAVAFGVAATVATTGRGTALMGVVLDGVVLGLRAVLEEQVVW